MSVTASILPPTTQRERERLRERGAYTEREKHFAPLMFDVDNVEAFKVL